MKSLLNTLALASAAVALPALAVTPLDPARQPVVDRYHGVAVTDPWRWLETPGPDVKAWVADQNARSRTYLDALPGRAAIDQQLTQFESRRTTRDSSVHQAGGRLFALTSEPGGQQPRLTTLALSGDPTSRKTILDPATLTAKGSVAIDWFKPSFDGRQVAVSLSVDGSEVGTLHVYATDTGAEIGKPIPGVQYPTGAGSLAWTADSTGFWYTRYPGADAAPGERAFNQQVYFHRVTDADSTQDVLVLGTRDGLPRTAEITLDNREGADVVLASVELGDGGEFQHFVLTQTSARSIAGYDRQIKSAAMARDGSVVGISFLNALNGKVVKLTPSASGPYAETLVQKEHALGIETVDKMADIVLAGNRVFFKTIDGGPDQIRSVDLQSGQETILQTPPVSHVTLESAMPDGALLYRVEDYLTPSRYQLWTVSTNQVVDTPMKSSAPYDTSGFEVRRLTAKSRDGTLVPFTAIVSKGFKADGKSPALLTGYGGYGISLQPSFISPLSWQFLQAGGVIAIANLRGGGEYGEAWHRAGMLTKKQNVFDDFDAVARKLVADRYTSHARLALRGGSNGGLLMGAMITQHPTLAKAVLSGVGIYDMLRVEVDPNGAFNTSEFGTVKDSAQFKALYAYSPLHHVKAGTHYPAILLTTGDNDGRVDSMQSRKFTAALETAGSKTTWLRTSAKSGHGIGSSLGERHSLDVDMTSFLFDQLGMTLAPLPAQ